MGRNHSHHQAKLPNDSKFARLFLVHFLCLFAPFIFSWGVHCLALVLYVVTGLFGITLSYHRNLAHKSFKLPKWLEYTFAYIGIQALQAVRIFLLMHSTFLVNSVCHVWGHQAWKTGDLSRNNGLIALISFGEGWHNNHHAFQSSARHGLECWQMDMTWYVITFLECIGLAKDLKVPSDLQKQKMLP
ncbi:hypothetical protein GIB67_013118 [Kingdonia uniflora]|uniref:Fatty acid desaturase domain-containing protein n=1 Tax=Kingdonia uniflora TaxID=39325 RepID=A0A7J7NNJ8_9MAGN|nr:hypothetical protein GIB67_013118 [Kingdonia uniflora]